MLGMLAMFGDVDDRQGVVAEHLLYAFTALDCVCISQLRQSTECRRFVE
jgi:hypothetical protein